MRALLLAALLLPASAWAQVAVLPVAEVHLGRTCDARDITWTQADPQPQRWELELRRVLSMGTTVTYDTPVLVTVPAGTPRWQGKVTQAGLYHVRVRACHASWTPTCTPWAESTSVASVVNAKTHLLNLTICPPGGFTPN